MRWLRGWRPSITLVLLLGFGGLVAAPVLGTNFLTLLALKRNTDELINDFARITLASIALQVDRSFTDARRQSAFVAEQVRERAVDPEDPDQMALLLRGALSGTPHVRGIAFFGPGGFAVRVGRIGDGIGTILDDWRAEPNVVAFIDDIEAGLLSQARTPIYVPTLDEPAISVETAVAGRDAPFQGAIASVIGMRDLSRFVAELSDQHQGTAFILTGENEVIAHPNLADLKPALSHEKPLPLRHEVGDVVLALLDDPTVFRERLDDIFPDGRLKGEFIRIERGAERIEKVVIMQELTGFDPEPWTIGIHYDADSVNSQVNRLIAAYVLMIAAAILVTLVGLLIGRGIARPIRRFAQAAEAIEVMDFSDIPQARRSFLKEIDETALRFDRMVTALKRLETYVPKPLVRRLMHAGDRPLAPEARRVTILFTDIEGFTSFSEGSDAPQVADFLNRHFSLVAETIDRHGGTVDKYIGDSVMAFWGALQDDPEQIRNAIAAAQEIRSRVNDATPTLRLRIGIHTGQVVAGSIGATGRVNYTIVGDAVNVAQRLEGLGRDHPHPSGITITVSSEVAAAAPEGVTPVSVGRSTLKGRDAPIEVFSI